MFGKLIKYELRCTLRKFLPLWGGVLVACLLCGAATRNDFLRDAGFLTTFFLKVLPFIALFGLAVATAVLTLVFVCKRFYSGLLGREGYLMFTLPVSTAELILSKLVTVMILEILSGAAAVLGAMLAFWVSGSSIDIFPSLADIRHISEVLPGWGWTAAECVLFCLLELASTDLKIYASISVGHLAKKNRALWAILAFVGISIVLSLLTSFFGVKLAGMEMIHTFFRGLEDSPAGILRGISAGAGAAVAADLLLCALYYFASHRILQNKLNLE